jgi:hypothetical protein
MTTDAKFHPLSSEELLYRECDAMLKHALSNGKQIPPTLFTDFDSVKSKVPQLNGLKIMSNEWMSDSLPFLLGRDDIHTLAHAHNTLVRIVAPARPQTLLLYQYESVKNGRWQVFGSVPLIRRLLAVAAISLIALIAFATSPLVEITGQNTSLFDFHGLQLVMNVCFLLAAAGLGASFNALFRARTFVTDYTYNPTYEASYWIEIAMGLIAGVILSEFVVFDVSEGSDLGWIMGRKVTVSLLGGFGGLLVYKILNRMVYVLEGVIRQKTEDKLDYELKKMEAASIQKLTAERNNLAREITKIQSEIVYKDLSKNDLNKRLENLADNVVDDVYKPTRDIPAEDDLDFDRETNGNYTNLDNPEHEADEYTERI